MNIGNALKELRQGHKQTWMAKQIGISQTHLSLVESGKKEPSLTLLKKYARYFKIPLPVLLWFSLTDQDIPEEKRAMFLPLKHTVDSLIKDLFTE